MKGQEARITFHPETWRRTCRVFVLLAVKEATAKTYFLDYDI